MVYYLKYEDEVYTIGETTMSGTMLADIGWKLLSEMIKKDIGIEKINIVDEKNKKYTITEFLNKINKNGIIIN
jgi:hypothetical protein